VRNFEIPFEFESAVPLRFDSKVMGRFEAVVKQGRKVKKAKRFLLWLTLNILLVKYVAWV